MGEWVWSIDLEGKSRIREYREITVSIPFTMDIVLHDLRFDGEGYITIDPPTHVFFPELYSDNTLKLRYIDKYGKEKTAEIGKYTPNSKITISYHPVEEEAEGRLKISLDGEETTLKVLPIYEKTQHTQIGIVSVYTGRAFPIERFFKLHGSITIKITSEQLPPPQPPEQPKPTPPTPPLPQPPEQPVPPAPPTPPTPPTKPTPTTLDIKSIEIRTTKTEYLPNEQIPITILIRLTEPADDKYPIYLNIWMTDPYGLTKTLKKTTIYTEKGEDQVKHSLSLAFTTTGVYIINVDAKLDDKPEHTARTMFRVVMEKPKPPTPPTPPPEKPTPTPPPEQPPTKPSEKPSTEALKKIAIIGGVITGIMAIWKLLKKKT